jgi:hypothetical protein
MPKTTTHQPPGPAIVLLFLLLFLLPLWGITTVLICLNLSLVAHIACRARQDRQWRTAR